jgi:hypothetical protein
LLFSAEPKDSIKDLFDRRVEVERFKDALNQRMVLVLGLASSLFLGGFLAATFIGFSGGGSWVCLGQHRGALFAGLEFLERGV